MVFANALLRAILVASIGLFLAACSSNAEDEEQGPAELVEFEQERVFNKVWSTSIGDGQGEIYNRLMPAIDQGNIYVAATNGEVEALSLSDGDSLWDVEVDQFLVGGVGLAANKVFLGAASGKVLALNRADGELLWESDVGGEVLAPPQANDSLVFVQTYDGQMLGLNIETGERVWSYRSNVPVLTLRGTSTPLLYRDSVLAGFANGNVVSFDAATGSVRWTTRVALAKGNSEIERIIDIDGAMLLSNKILYVSSYQGRVAAIDADSGRRIWSNDASSYVGMSEGFGNIYVVGEDGSVSAYDKTGQGVRWAQTILARRKLSGSVAMGSYIVVGDLEGYLHGLSQVDGRIIARTKFDGDGVQADLLKVDDVLIAYSNGGKLSAYRLEEKSSGFSLF